MKGSQLIMSVLKFIDGKRMEDTSLVFKCHKSCQSNCQSLLLSILIFFFLPQNPAEWVVCYRLRVGWGCKDVRRSYVFFSFSFCGFSIAQLKGKRGLLN